VTRDHAELHTNPSVIMQNRTPTQRDQAEPHAGVGVQFCMITG